jgi:hypothetical protein
VAASRYQRSRVRRTGQQLREAFRPGAELWVSVRGRACSPSFSRVLASSIEDAVRDYHDTRLVAFVAQ